MSIAYSDPFSGHQPGEPRRQDDVPGIGTLLMKPVAQVPRHRLVSLAVSIAAHVALLFALVFLTLGPTRQRELQAITVSITTTQVSKPDPAPMPQLERVPEVVMPDLPQIETAVAPSPSAIRAAPPPVAQAQSESRKKTEDAQETPPRFDADYLNNPVPVYPNMSRRLREAGTTELRVRVSNTGEPLEIQLFKSSGYSRLDEAALAAVKKWKFQPAMRNGKAAEGWVWIPLQFGIKK